MSSNRIVPQKDKTPIGNRIGKMTFTPRRPPQEKAKAVFEFEDMNGDHVMRIALDKERVWHQYYFGDKDLLRLKRNLDAYIKKAHL